MTHVRPLQYPVNTHHSALRQCQRPAELWPSHQGRRREIFVGGRIHGHWAPKPTYPKILFLLEFRSIYFENVRKCKILLRVKKKS